MDKRRQLALDFGERRQWSCLPDGHRQECRDLLVRLLETIVVAERTAPEVSDE